MANEHGEWIMRGLDWDDPARIRRPLLVVRGCRAIWSSAIFAGGSTRRGCPTDGRFLFTPCRRPCGDTIISPRHTVWSGEVQGVHAGAGKTEFPGRTGFGIGCCFGIMTGAGPRMDPRLFHTQMFSSSVNTSSQASRQPAGAVRRRMERILIACCRSLSKSLLRARVSLPWQSIIDWSQFLHREKYARVLLRSEGATRP